MSKHLLTIFCLLLLSACNSSFKRHNLPMPETVQQLQRWQLQGRIALKSANEGFSAGLNWTEELDGYLFELNGPLGETRARLRATPELSTLKLPNETAMTSTNTEQLLADNFGWAVPISSLRNWVRGIPDTNSEALQLDEQGRPKQFTSNGWQVKYLAWQDIHGLTLPKRLEASNQQLSIKLSLHDWQF